MRALLVVLVLVSSCSPSVAHAGGCLVGPSLLAVADPVSVGATDDEVMEEFLLNARVVRIHELLPGSTYPMALELERFGTVRKAAFKYRPADLADPTDVDSEGSTTVDSYLHEVAAYRLDRALGLGMVPVAVIRDIHAEGAVIEWISGAVTAQELREGGDDRADSAAVFDQQAMMNLFDALILNEDRNESDQLFTTEDLKLHLLDHSRAFKVADEALPRFFSRPASVSRSLLQRLVELDAESLGVLLEGLLTAAQIDAMLNRRDRILKKISSDRREYGDASVFLD